MPTYTYQCAAMAEFDVEQRITEPALTECPLCSKCVPRRLISGTPGFTLIAGESGGWASSGYGHKPHELDAMRTLGRKLTKPAR